MTILIARHGETDSNARRIIQTPEIPLSQLGNEQAKKLANRIHQLGISRIISSDYLRTQQTAEHVATITGVKIEYNPLLRERNFGDLRGIPYEELLHDPFDITSDYVPPNGESWGVFNQRVDLAWQAVYKEALRSQGKLLVVTHGLVCRSLYQRVFLIPESVKDLSNFGNTALSEVEETEPWTMQLLNCTSHLQGQNLLSSQALA